MGSGDPSDAARAAMSEACFYVRLYPKLVHWMTTCDADAEPVLENIRRRTAIKKWLRLQTFRREEECLMDLLDKADTFVNHSGQSGRLIETYRQQRDSGKLDDLSPTARAVHRAVFSLGIYYGAPVLGSLRYVQLAVLSQSGRRVSVSHTRIQQHVENLVKRGLFLDYNPGKRTHYRNQAGKISLELTPVTGEPGVDLMLDLWLSIDTQIRLAEYVAEAHERNLKHLADLRERRAAMLTLLCREELDKAFADILDSADELEILRVNEESVYVPARVDDVVFTHHGSAVHFDLAIELDHHVNGCESTYVSPFSCWCNAPQVELHEEWVTWGLRPGSGGYK